MSIGPFLQADIIMPLRHVHKTEEKKKRSKNRHKEAPQTQPEAET